MVKIGLQMSLVNSTPCLRWNFDKTAWCNNASDSTKYLNYKSAIVTISKKKYVPRAYRKDSTFPDGMRLTSSFIKNILTKMKR